MPAAAIHRAREVRCDTEAKLCWNKRENLEHARFDRPDRRTVDLRAPPALLASSSRVSKLQAH